MKRLMFLMRHILLLLALVAAAFPQTNANPAFFTYQIGGTAPGAESYSITSEGTSQIVGLMINTSGQPWILPSLSSTTTPSTLTINVNPTGMPVGTYYGAVEVSSTDMANTLYFSVSLTITAAPPPVSASPSSLTFNAVQGSAPPSPQTVTIGASLPAGTIIYSSCCAAPPSWMAMSIENQNQTTAQQFFCGAEGSVCATTPATVQVSITPEFASLAPGTYTTSLEFQTAPEINISNLPNSSVTVPITLVIAAPPPVLITNTNQVQFQYMMDGSLPTAYTLQVTSSGSPLSATVTTSAAWLSVNTQSGTTPFSTNVSVNPASLGAGTYNGQVVVASSSSPSQTISVTLTVTPDNRPVITSVVNGASFQPTITPGGWISVVGKNFSTSPLQTTSAYLPTSLDGVSVQLSGLGGAYSLLVDYVSPLLSG